MGLVWCCFYIWPPIPSKIVNKMAFYPDNPSYSFIQETQDANPSKMVLNENTVWPYSELYINSCVPFIVTTSRGNQIACTFFRKLMNTKFTLFFSHGNAVDLGDMSIHLYILSFWLDCNVFSYDYSGFGISTGKPSEKNLYADADCAWDILIDRLGIKNENIILYGQSIGSVPTIYLAARNKVGGVVLHSPLASGLKFFYPPLNRSLCFDVLNNMKEMKKVTSPVLIIHGRKDQVIAFSHSEALYAKCRNPVEPLWLDNYDHNNIEYSHSYFQRLQRFVNDEVCAKSMDVPYQSEQSSEITLPSANSKHGIYNSLVSLNRKLKNSLKAPHNSLQELEQKSRTTLPKKLSAIFCPTPKQSLKSQISEQSNEIQGKPSTSKTSSKTGTIPPTLI